VFLVFVVSPSSILLGPWDLRDRPDNITTDALAVHGGLVVRPFVDAREPRPTPHADAVVAAM
jgi:hypothetical protein